MPGFSGHVKSVLLPVGFALAAIVLWEFFVRWAKVPEAIPAAALGSARPDHATLFS